jgi:peptide-methionine (R)-S-oxide reductase
MTRHSGLNSSIQENGLIRSPSAKDLSPPETVQERETRKNQMSDSNQHREDDREAAIDRRSSRRAFFVTSAGACRALALWSLRLPWSASAATSENSTTPATVTIVQFGAGGKQTGKIVEPRLVKSEAEWKQQLSPISYEVARRAGTERAYSGNSWDLHDRGLFRCLCCDTALFSSETKFDSGTGWPSFLKPIAKENVVEIKDSTLGDGTNCHLLQAL